MTLHLVKLCVGCDSIAELASWIRDRMRQAKARGQPRHHVHVTRMAPKRAGELIDGGSLYWVIRGEIACREKLIAVDPFRDRDSIGRCRLVMAPKVIPVAPRPMRAFQGWRYLDAKDAPPDLGGKGGGKGNGDAALPEELRRELRELGLM